MIFFLFFPRCLELICYSIEELINVLPDSKDTYVWYRDRETSQPSRKFSTTRPNEIVKTPPLPILQQKKQS